MRPDNLRLRIVSNGEKFRVEAEVKIKDPLERSIGSCYLKSEMDNAPVVREHRCEKRTGLFSKTETIERDRFLKIDQPKREWQLLTKSGVSVRSLDIPPYVRLLVEDEIKEIKELLRKPAEFSTRNAALGWIKQKFGETALDHAVVPAEWRP